MVSKAEGEVPSNLVFYLTCLWLAVVQNPVNTPVMVRMDRAHQSFLHVSQNVPTNSPLEVRPAACIASLNVELM